MSYGPERRELQLCDQLLREWSAVEEGARAAGGNGATTRATKRHQQISKCKKNMINKLLIIKTTIYKYINH